MQMKYDHQITLIGKKCKAARELKQTKIIFETCKKSYNHIVLQVKTFFFGDLKDISSIHHIIMCFFNQKHDMINDIVL